MPYSHELPLSSKKIARCRAIATSIGKQVGRLVHENSTVGTERAVLRLLGFNEALENEGLLLPLANPMVDSLKRSERFASGRLVLGR